MMENVNNKIDSDNNKITNTRIKGFNYLYVRFMIHKLSQEIWKSKEDCQPLVKWTAMSNS
jgi:hypothetical protein